MANTVNYEKLLKGIKNVIERGDYPKFLQAIKKMKNSYSFRNTMLVFSQNPRATYVKGFVDWGKLGRGIKKHPRKIYIYAPMKYSYKKNIVGQQKIEGKEEKESKNGNIEIIEGVKYKKIIVYDFEDTYLKKGEKRIPILDDRLNNNTTENLYKTLLDISPVEVKIDEIPGRSKGYYSKEDKVIKIEKSLSPDEKTAVLIHELVHCLYDDYDYKVDRDKSETMVESVAFLVADHFGFDTSICSFGYITTWINNDIKNFMKVSNKIKETADEFIKLIEQEEYKQEKIIA